MARLIVYNFLTLNGFYKAPGGDIRWASKQEQSQEEDDFALENLKKGSILLFGRATYDMMITYWPTEQATKNNPGMAKKMNEAEKIVFSSTLKKAEWNNTRIIGKDMIKEIGKMKGSSLKDMTILGSGSIVTQFAEAGLIDEYQFMLYPVALGEGTSEFDGMDRKLELRLDSTRSFKNGCILLTYKPVSKE